MLILTFTASHLHLLTQNIRSLCNGMAIYLFQIEKYYIYLIKLQT